MPNNDAIVRQYSTIIISHAEEHNQRTGQYLFNSFPWEVAEALVGAPWDPFHFDMSQDRIETWLNEHIIFNDNGRIVGVFSGNTILWEDPHA